MTETTKLRFYFDPVCPWAWRTSLWVREVQKERALDVEWDFLSLKAVNSGNPALKDTHFQSEASFRIMALVRRTEPNANEIINQLYLAFGKARHERALNIGEPEVVNEILQEVGLDPALYTQAMEDPSTLEDVQTSHTAAVENGGFGVPTLVIEYEDGTKTKGMFGPVISEVPTGTVAAELWDNTAWLMRQPYFFEFKRSR